MAMFPAGSCRIVNPDKRPSASSRADSSSLVGTPHIRLNAEVVQCELSENSMKADTSTLQETLNGDRRFVVPVYPRRFDAGAPIHRSPPLAIV